MSATAYPQGRGGLVDIGRIHKGTPGYLSGDGGGTCSVPAGARVTGIDGYAHAVDGTFTIDGGTPITVRAGVGRWIDPGANYIGPLDIVFSASLDWIVTWVTP